jgi:hypothetical protein
MVEVERKTRANRGPRRIDRAKTGLHTASLAVAVLRLGDGHRQQAPSFQHLGL